MAGMPWELELCRAVRLSRLMCPVRRCCAARAALRACAAGARCLGEARAAAARPQVITIDCLRQLALVNAHTVDIMLAELVLGTPAQGCRNTRLGA